MLKVNRKKYKILAAVGMGTCLIAGGTSAAYLKDAVGEVQNVITVGNIKAGIRKRKCIYILVRVPKRIRL